MQKEGGRSPASGCVDDACLICLARKLAAIALLPLFTLPYPSEDHTNFQNCFESLPECPGMSPARTQFHRPWEWYYRPKLVLSAKHVLPVGTQHCRPANSSCWNLQLTAAEGKQCMAWNFQANICMDTLPIMQWTQGSMTLDPQAINYAFQCMMA